MIPLSIKIRIGNALERGWGFAGYKPSQNPTTRTVLWIQLPGGTGWRPFKAMEPHALSKILNEADVPKIGERP